MKKKSTKKENKKGRPFGAKENKNPYNLISLRNRLLKEREDKQLTLNELSDRTNISDKTLSAFETGKRKPNIDDLISIAKALSVPIDYLLGLQEQKSINFEIRELSKQTNLSEKAIQVLNNTNAEEIEMINRMFEYKDILYIIDKIIDFYFMKFDIDRVLNDEEYSYIEIEQIKISRLVMLLKEFKYSNIDNYSYYLEQYEQMKTKYKNINKELEKNINNLENSINSKNVSKNKLNKDEELLSNIAKKTEYYDNYFTNLKDLENIIKSFNNVNVMKGNKNNGKK